MEVEKDVSFVHEECVPTRCILRISSKDQDIATFIGMIFVSPPQSTAKMGDDDAVCPVTSNKP